MNLFPNVHSAIQATRHYLLRNGEIAVTDKWQGKTGKHKFFEALNWSFSCPIPFTKEEMIRQISPNVEWADAQFKERVGGVPLNPGESFKIWPMYKNNPANDQFRKDEKFSHTYMERFWPKHAGEDGIKQMPNKGIRYTYGDFQDVINLLSNDPGTRQAYLPIWFPEDTGAVHGGRVPCTIGYWFIRRQGQLHITYHIRACDFYRHFRDDIYLAIALVHDVLHCLQVGERGNHWADTTPGIFTMNIGSLHIFSHEIKILQNEQAG